MAKPLAKVREMSLRVNGQRQGGEQEAMEEAQGQLHLHQTAECARPQSTQDEGVRIFV